MKSIDISYSPANSFKKGNPFCLAFVYPERGKPYLIKGGAVDVEKRIRDSVCPCFVHYSFWHKGKSRCLTRFENLPNNYSGFISSGRKHTLRVYVKGDKYAPSLSQVFKRVPRYWPKSVSRFFDLMRKVKNKEISLLDMAGAEGYQ